MSEATECIENPSVTKAANGKELVDDNSAIITANELVSKSDVKEENLTHHQDEITSLEREIAELHHVEPSTPSIAQKVNDVVTSSLTNDDLHNIGEKVILEMQPPQSRNSTLSSAREGNNGVENNEGMVDHNKIEPETLEEEDLIAVLKGVENEHQTVDDAAVAGVTIEGEGEFQIMEIDDDEPEESESNEDNLCLGKEVIGKGVSNYMKPIITLTKEEERQMAMEQMKGLKSWNIENKRKRKQDIKPKTPDLVSMLGADWSDEDAVEQAEKITVSDASNELKPSTKGTQAPQSTTTSTTIASALEKPKQEKVKPRKTPPQITSVVVLKSGSASSQSVSATSNTCAAVEYDKEKREKETATAQSQPQITGFKRTRIIKRKIIWDPDAPETQFSYATLVRPSSSSSNISAKTKAESNKSTSLLANKAPTSGSLLKKEQVQKKVRPTTPKEGKTSVVDDKSNRAATPKLLVKAAPAIAVPKKSKPLDTSPSPTTSPVKRRSQTPVANIGNKKKKTNEVDRLMGDEGAINMLTSLENERQKAADASELVKPNMRSRSATISEKIPKRDLTPVKKETPTTKQKRTPKPKASSSWDYVYKQQAAEDSMIIRRRSNSSYSSTASIHRVSLDAPSTSSAKNTQKTTQKEISTNIKSATNSTHASVNKSSPKNPNSSSNTSMGDTSLKGLNTSANSLTISPTGKTFEFAKPESKSNQKSRNSKSPQVADPLASDIKKATNVGNKKSPLARSNPTTEDKSNKSASQEDTTNCVVIKRLGKVSQILFSTNNSRIDYTFNIEILNSIAEALHKLSTDNECNVVVMATNAPNFCHGIDYTDLALGSLEKRKKAATLLGAAVKNFVKALAAFPKPLIAGVNGSSVGLGVMILPLFDIVVGSDKGSYETLYAKIGQLPEGYCIWNKLSKIRGTFKTKLLWLCEKLHSTESALSGLVNKLTSPGKVNEDSLVVAKKIAGMSVESYRTMKQTTIESMSNIVTETLDKEFETIIRQWTSDICFENFKKYVETGHW